MKKTLVAVWLLALLLSLSWVGLASPGALSIPWYTVDGGGGTSTGGGYTVSGTAGQPDAGLLTGGEYRLGGGFWGGGEVVLAPGFEYYLPLVMRSGP